MKSSLECLNKLKEDYAASAVSLAGETKNTFFNGKEGFCPL